MNNRYLQIIVLVILAVLALFVIRRNPQSKVLTITDFQTCQMAGGAILQTEPVQCVAFDGRKFEESVSAESEVVVDSPKFGDMVTSPMMVKGKARGNWFFEANLPATLKDENGNILVQKGMQATSDWMTSEFVPFEGTLEFATPITDYGVLIIQKDNPSGLPQYDSSFAVPVKFR